MKQTIFILTTNDFRKGANRSLFTVHDFNLSTDQINKASLIVLVDDKKQTHVLKQRSAWVINPKETTKP